MGSKKLLENFTKEFCLPIHVFEYPYFGYLMDLYDKDYNTWYYYDLLSKALNKTGSEKYFFITYNLIRKNVSNSIVNSSEYELFNKSVEWENNYKFKRKNIYIPKNDNKLFFSIDLKQANFYSVKCFFKGLVRNCDTYEEFISLFTDLEYIKESRRFRMIVFSILTQQKLDILQIKLLNNAMSLVKRHFSENSIIVTSPDEFVVMLNNPTDYLQNKELQNDINLLEKKLQIEFNKNVFRLKQLKPFNYFVKEYENGKVEFKNVPKMYFPQVYKRYYNMELSNYDLMVYKKSKLNKFRNALKFVNC
ncbi:hypothetical protein A0J52_06565 [Clostridium sporogenes]|uniref:hypothetical protein n=1 Tax=Clostridium sporogenes TaxID=1509 RepID=UPI00077FF4ED|nr:hypothetical protein [Clostridium sporogenes]KYN78941.1 hypothetical protein A0J52_06565 [Clostridium sporogenes]